MDREASATASECHQKRGREELGTPVPGISTELRRADRGGSGGPGEIQNEGAGEVAKLSEPNQQSTAGRLAAICARLVGILPTGRESPPDLPAGGMDSTAHPEMLLAAVARTR